jgi:hypothetical protein
MKVARLSALQTLHSLLPQYISISHCKIPTAHEMTFNYLYRQQATIQYMKQELQSEIKHIKWRNGLENRDLMRKIMTWNSKY